MQYLAIVPILAFLIIIHELGHFLAARSVGVTVEEFGIGLPPRVKGWRRKGVLWSINALPIGGFVRVKGEDANDRSPGSMQNASPWARAWFLIAGPLMNLGAAVIISMILVANQGMPAGDRVFINLVEPGSPAAAANWQPGDQLISIDGHTIATTEDASQAVQGNLGDETEVVLQRGDETITTTVIPREHPPEGQGSTGISFANSKLSDVTVREVGVGSQAAEGGLQPDDKIIAINGVEIVSMGQAGGMLNASFGQPVTITYERDGETGTAKLDVPAASMPITSVNSGSPASRAEMYATDEISSINGEPITTGQAFISSLVANSGKDVEIGFTRHTEGGPLELTTTLAIPDISELERSQVLSNVGLALLQPSGFHELGLEPVGMIKFESVPASEIIPRGWNQFTSVITGTVDALQQAFTGGAPLDQFVGPIGMGQMTGELLDASSGNVVPVLLQLTMLISISLGLFNLLPIPALDGGRLVFVILEILRGGKRVPPEKEGAVHMIGMLVLLGLIFFIAFGDITRILDGDSLFP